MLILAAIAYLLFFFKWPGDSPLGNIVNNVRTVNKIVKESLPATEEKKIEQVKKPTENAKPPVSEEIEKNTAAKIASSFAERFGSYSNQSDYGNITDLRSFMTDKMQAWADKYIADQRKKNPYTPVYQGAIAKAISFEVKSFDAAAGSAEVKVSAQRSEFSGDSKEPKVYYQDIVIKMIKENSSWKVDSAFWQESK